MAIRAKFRVVRIERGLHSDLPRRATDRPIDIQDPTTYREDIREVRAIVLAPVFDRHLSDDERDKFWQPMPDSGTIKLQTLDPRAWEHFELGRSYYLDIVPADE